MTVGRDGRDPARPFTVNRGALIRRLAELANSASRRCMSAQAVSRSSGHGTPRLPRDSLEASAGIGQDLGRRAHGQSNYEVITK